MIQSDTPLITIGITSYNAEDTIEQAINSALKQTWSNIEIIIIDDCSSDNTMETIQNIAKNNALITKVDSNKQNRGVAYTRNRIIQYSQGKFIAFFDDDDTSNPDRLARQHKRISEYQTSFAQNAPILCYTAREQKYPDKTTHIEQTSGIESGIAPHGRDVAYKILMGYPLKTSFGSMATCSQMAPTAFLKALGGFDESLKRSEDTELNVRAAIEGAHFVGISDTLVTQNMTSDNDKPLSLERECMLMMLTKHAATVEQMMSVNFCIKWTNLKYDFLEGKRVSFVLKLGYLMLRHPISTTKRLMWSLPNTKFNMKSQKFYQNHAN